MGREGDLAGFYSRFFNAPAPAAFEKRTCISSSFCLLLLLFTRNRLRVSPQSVRRTCLFFAKTFSRAPSHRDLLQIPPYSVARTTPDKRAQPSVHGDSVTRPEGLNYCGVPRTRFYSRSSQFSPTAFLFRFVFYFFVYCICEFNLVTV